MIEFINMYTVELLLIVTLLISLLLIIEWYAIKELVKSKEDLEKEVKREYGMKQYYFRETQDLRHLCEINNIKWTWYKKPKIK